MKKITAILTSAVLILPTAGSITADAAAGSIYDMCYGIKPGLWLLQSDLASASIPNYHYNYIVVDEDGSTLILNPETGDANYCVLSRIKNNIDLIYKFENEVHHGQIISEDNGLLEYEMDGLQFRMKLVDENMRIRNFKWYTPDELMNRALNFYAYYHEGYRPGYAEYNVPRTGYEGKAQIKLYDIIDDHTATSDIYTVDIVTGTGSDILNDTVDLSEEYNYTSSFRPGLWLAESEGGKYANTYYYFSNNSADGMEVDQHTGDRIYYTYLYIDNKLKFTIGDPDTEKEPDLVYDIKWTNERSFEAYDEDGSKQTFTYVRIDSPDSKKIYSDVELQELTKKYCKVCFDSDPDYVDVALTDTGLVSLDAYNYQNDKKEEVIHISADRYTGRAFDDNGSDVPLYIYYDAPDYIRPGVWETIHTLNTPFRPGYLIINEDGTGYQIDMRASAVTSLKWERSGNKCTFTLNDENKTTKEMYIENSGQKIILTNTVGDNNSVELRYLGDIAYSTFNLNAADMLFNLANEHYRRTTGTSEEIFNTVDLIEDRFMLLDVIVDEEMKQSYYIDKFSGMAEVSDGTIVNLFDYMIDVAKSMGDVNLDGLIDSSDASMVLELYAKVSTGSGNYTSIQQQMISDVNGDGLVDSNDASAILKYYSYASTAEGNVLDIKTFMEGDNSDGSRG